MNDKVLLSDEEEDDEFFSVSNTYNKTSKNIINPLDPKRLGTELCKLTESHVEEKIKLVGSYYKSGEKIYNHTFNKMYNDLKLNYSVLINGIGSKSKVLKKFIDFFCKDGPTIIFKGYLPGLSIRDLLYRITFTIFGIDKSFGSPISHCSFIKSIFEGNNQEKLQFYGSRYSFIPKHLYILIYSIDGAPLRNTTSQTVLASLSSILNIHLIATAETSSPALLWDNNLFKEFQWVVHTLTTFEPYKKELVYQKSLIHQTQKSSSSLDSSSVLTVLQSLPKKTNEIFTELLKYLVEKKKNKINFKELFEISKENFLVSTENGLRTQLREFIDHKIIIKKTVGDTEYLLVKLEFSTMQVILDQLIAFEEE